MQYFCLQHQVQSLQLVVKLISKLQHSSIDLYFQIKLILSGLSLCNQFLQETAHQQGSSTERLCQVRPRHGSRCFIKQDVQSKLQSEQAHHAIQNAKSMSSLDSCVEP